MFDELVDYIKENYPRAQKIVEVGVGHRIDVAQRIKNALPLTQILVTDKDEASVRSHRTVQVQTIADDVMFPQSNIYIGSLLIYSIHPPFEIIAAMTNLAARVGADLLVVPRSDEQEAFHHENWQKLTRNGRTVGWLRVFRRENSSRPN